MKRYRPSSELHRAAEQAVRNEERLAAYHRRRARHTASVAEALARVARGTATVHDAALLAAAIKGVT